MLKHHVFLIHGVTDASNTERDFRELSNRIRSQFRSKHRLDPDEHLEIVPIEWHHAVADAERVLFEKSFGPVRPTDKAFLSPILGGKDGLSGTIESLRHLPRPMEVLFSRFNKWRETRYFVTSMLGDVIAYVDESDNGIRWHVWKALKTHLIEKSNEVPRFSIVGHGLGSIVAFDFLHDLLAPNGPSLFTFGKGESRHEKVDNPKLNQIKEAFQNLYTLGSPLSLFLMRKKQIWTGVENGDVSFDHLRNPFHGTTSRWINFIDDDDVTAYPVEPFFNTSELGQRPNPCDVFVKSGWLPLPHSAITGYWRCDEVARQIARTLTPAGVKERDKDRAERELAAAR